MKLLLVLKLKYFYLSFPALLITSESLPSFKVLFNNLLKAVVFTAMFVVLYFIFDILKVQNLFLNLFNI